MPWLVADLGASRTDATHFTHLLLSESGGANRHPLGPSRSIVRKGPFRYDSEPECMSDAHRRCLEGGERMYPKMLYESNRLYKIWYIS